MSATSARGRSFGETGTSPGSAARKSVWRPASPPPLLAPILFRLPLHGGCMRVRALDPVGRAAGAVGRRLALRHDAFQAELAGVAEDGLAVALDVFVPSQAGPHLDQQGS